MRGQPAAGSHGFTAAEAGGMQQVRGRVRRRAPGAKYSIFGVGRAGRESESFGSQLVVNERRGGRAYDHAQDLADDTGKRFLGNLHGWRCSIAWGVAIVGPRDCPT